MLLNPASRAPVARAPGPARAYVALGSNRGDRRAHLEGAVAALRSAPSLRVLAVSRWIETEPVGGPPGQRRFLNGVLALETALAPAALLDLLQEIERAHGRRRVLEVRHGPRTLDLDLLLHGRRRIVSERLTLPHPGLEQRLFVLRPLAEIAPGLVLPRSRLTVLGRLGELERAARRSTGLAGLAGAGA